MDNGVANNGSRSDRYLAWLETDGAPPYRCYVNSISAAGARVYGLGEAIPDEFTLHFGRQGDAMIRCRVRSRTGTRCDVEFVACLALYERKAA